MILWWYQILASSYSTSWSPPPSAFWQADGKASRCNSRQLKRKRVNQHVTVCRTSHTLNSDCQIHKKGIIGQTSPWQWQDFEMRSASGLRPVAPRETSCRLSNPYLRICPPHHLPMWWWCDEHVKRWCDDMMIDDDMMMTIWWLCEIMICPPRIGLLSIWRLSGIGFIPILSILCSLTLLGPGHAQVPAWYGIYKMVWMLTIWRIWIWTEYESTKRSCQRYGPYGYGLDMDQED